MVTPTTSWDETAPPGSQARSLGDDRIREMKIQLRELMAIDHTMSSSGSGATWGMHKIIRLLVQTTITELADAGCLYTKDVDSKAELHFKDEDANEVGLTRKGSLNLPAGSIMMHGGTTAPTGWLLCQGQAVNRTTYANLFTAVGTTFGVGDGTTTFNLPDLQDKFPIGKSSTKALGATGGSATHTHTSTIADDAIYLQTNLLGVGQVTQVSNGSLSKTSTEPDISTSSTSTLPSYQAVNYIIKT